MKKVLLFDFDGTVMDGSGCIMSALEDTCNALGFEMPPKERLKGFIGPPIVVSMQMAGFADEDIPRVLDYYRMACRKPECMRKFKFFDGMPEMLASLKAKGYKMAIVSMRTQGSLEDIAKVHGYSEYFDCIYGRQGDTDTNEKSELLERVFRILDAKKEECIIIGDSIYDEQGACAAGIDFVAVTYGFGYESEKDVKDASKICKSIPELSEYLMNL